ncbi:restriction endonuclease subunit S [Arenibacter sp. TNZ]|uniref:restriction endonuclease subunit S n=1 Tax=Arenibacter TaxID=178469 RepID=UPI000CD45DEA|nr:MULTISPECIES: restriction endonuclease subunit S [Arenibacter]MCM4172401.1 restriction endonuclease subunit S [Arenibacter sp. TNZ]
MKIYNKYKDSGVDWIGEIPEHWEINRLANFGKFLKGRGITKADLTDNGVQVVLYGDIYTKYDLYTKKLERRTSYENAQRAIEIYKGDLLFTASGETKKDIGKCVVFLGEDEAYASGDVIIFRQLKNNWMFLAYVFNSYHVNIQKARLSKGEIVVHIYASQLRNIHFVLPPLEEQTQIANYLNQKTAEIDTLIAKKEQLIKLLEEERTAMINQAVTKGLDPNVPMKDSGIDWLGEIPEHWESRKIGHAFDRIGSGTTPESGNPLYHENGTINWLNTGDLNDGVLFSCGKKITEKAIDDYSSLKKFPSGSLVVAMYGATIGKTAIVKFETTTNQACCVLCENSTIGVEFLQQWIIVNKNHIINLAIGGGQPNISQYIIKDIRVCCPVIYEQYEIVKYIKKIASNMDGIISKAQQEIDLLKEYKTALISEVVTGKVDVRKQVSKGQL